MTRGTNAITLTVETALGPLKLRAEESTKGPRVLIVDNVKGIHAAVFADQIVEGCTEAYRAAFHNTSTGKGE